MELTDQLEVVFTGKFGLFTAPGLRVERFSSPHPGGSQLRGMIESIAWHPGWITVIDHIGLMTPPKYYSAAHNEVADVPNKCKRVIGISDPKNRAQSIRTLLLNPAYIVRFRFLLVDDGVDPRKPHDIFSKRLRLGQHYPRRPPCMGRSRYPAIFRPLHHRDRVISDNADFGTAILDIDSNTGRVYTFHSIMRHGWIEFPHLEHALEKAPRVREELALARAEDVCTST
jgi:hypothetical protein